MRNKIKMEPHLRLTAQELKADYKAGLLPGPTYLLYLLRSLRKDGHRLSIDGIPEFCKEWGIPLRTFYRAKAKLVSLGLVQEEIRGRVDLWVPTPAEQAEEAADEAAEDAKCIELADPTEEENEKTRDPLPWMVRNGRQWQPDPNFLAFLEREYAMKPANARIFASCLSNDPARRASQQARVSIYWQEYQRLAIPHLPTTNSTNGSKGSLYRFVDLPTGERVGMAVTADPVEIESDGHVYAVWVADDGEVRIEEVIAEVAGNGCR